MSKGYFQFPLCFLAFGENHKERLQHIASYSVYEQAKRTSPGFPKTARRAALDTAARFLGVTIGSHNATIDRWKQAANFVSQWECRNGKDASVRIATRLLWEAYNGTGVTYREFSILCAINSIIGSRRSVPRRITEPSVRVRAAGFKSWKVAQAELSSSDAGESRRLTAHQVRYTLRKLHQRKFFARARVGAKTVKYMLCVSDEQLRSILLQSATYQARFTAERARKDRDLMAAIRAVKQTPTVAGKDQNELGPVTTQSPHSTDIVPDMIPDINISTLNNGSFNKGTENISKKNIAPLSRESGRDGFIKKKEPTGLDRLNFNDEELDFIDLYHRICCAEGLGFLRVTKRSPELDKALEIFAPDFDEDEWTEKFREAVEYRRKVFRTNPCKYNTLVQVCWKLNY